VQPIAATLIVIVLIGLALYFGRQQVDMLRRLHIRDELADDDRRYYRRQAWLRLTTSGLLLALAAVVATYYLLGLDAGLNDLANRIQARRDRGEAVNELDAEEQRQTLQGAYFILAMLLLLLTILVLMAIDIWAIRRYGRRHFRQLQADRRAMVEGEIARLRSERNGHG
jgi:hypothetical protein